MELKIRTLTPLWTGDVDQECKKIKETGIIGSLRWWYEALVRGLGGRACDPTSDVKEFKKCELKRDKFDKAIKSGKSTQEALDGQICPACQLFGCTNWKKRFRLEISGVNDDDFVTGKGPNSGLRENREFSANLIFLSEIRPEEKWLFKKTLWIIENYGAIGGRTTWKPESSRETSYGLIEIKDYGEIEEWDSESSREKVKKWLEENKKKLRKENDNQWFNFMFYWVVEGRYLDKNQMNDLLKLIRVGGKKVIPEKGTENDEFLNFIRGKQGESKKIFSFGNEHNIPKPFVFGYVRNEKEINKIKGMLQKELGNDINFRTGKGIMGEIL